jgi:hypothetical protein
LDCFSVICTWAALTLKQGWVSTSLYLSVAIRLFSVDHALHAVTDNCLVHGSCDHAFRCALFTWQQWPALGSVPHRSTTIFKTSSKVNLKSWQTCSWLLFFSWISRHPIRYRVFCYVRHSGVTRGVSSSVKIVLNLTSTVTTRLRTGYRHALKWC